MKGRPIIVGKDRVSLRVQLSRDDYEALRKIAEKDRTDLSSLVRRAIARSYLVVDERSTESGDSEHGQR